MAEVDTKRLTQLEGDLQMAQDRIEHQDGTIVALRAIVVQARLARSQREANAILDLAIERMPPLTEGAKE